MANTTSSFPIDFDFYNADQEQVLFITDEVTGQDMTLEITNTSNEPITTVALSGAASATNCHFELIFRPDTLFNTPSALQLPDNQFELFVDKDAQGSIKPNADGTLSLFIKMKSSWTLPVGGKLPIKLSHLRAAASDGTRGTRVMLKYKNLLHAGDTNSFSGFKETHLNIVNHRGKQNIPLHLGFVGANTVLNDGKSPNTLKLRISNISRKAIAIDAAANSKFTLVLEGGSEQEEWTLATVDQIDKAVVKYKRPGDAALIEATGVTEWIIPFAKLQKGQFIDIEISNLITNHPTGHANLYLHYENIPGYWDGEKTLIIEKSPFVFKNKNVGVGTSAPEMKLDVVGGLGIRNEAAWDHLFIEHDGGTAFLNAGGAEHGMALRVGTGANGSYKGQDYTDVMRLMPNGKIGIGTPNPEGKLQIINQNQSGYGDTLILGPTNASNLRLGYGAENSWIQSHGSKPLAINPEGNNVGIGIVNPAGKLTVVPPKDARGFEILSPSAGNTHLPWSDNWNYISGNGVIFRDRSNAEKMRFDASTGNVGIGTTNPTKGRLEIEGHTSYQFPVKGGIGLLGSDVYGNWGAQPAALYGSAIYTGGKVLAHSFLVPSDLRIKEISGKSDSTQDLEILNKIEIIDYKMKDVIAKGNTSYKKVVAQQVKDVYPTAISTSTDVVPDIYQHAHLENGWVSLEINLKKGEKVQLIFGSEKILLEVLEVDEHRFKVDTERQGSVFVYGREVDDFLSVDYEALAMLNISATQALFTKLEMLRKENSKLKSNIETLEKRDAINQEALEKIYARLQMLENK